MFRVSFVWDRVFSLQQWLTGAWLVVGLSKVNLGSEAGLEECMVYVQVWF